MRDRVSAVRHLQQTGHCAHLGPRASRRLAGRSLVGVDGLPVGLGDQQWLAFGEPTCQFVGIPGTDLPQLRTCQIGHQRVDGVLGVLLLVPITPDGPRLIQPAT